MLILVLSIKFVVNENAFVSDFNFLLKPNRTNVHLSFSSTDLAFLSVGVKSDLICTGAWNEAVLVMWLLWIIGT